MKTLQLTSKTKEEIAAEFEATFKDIKPQGKVTLEQCLEPYREAILQQCERGLTWQQIATGMAGPLINQKVAARTLATLFGGKANARKRTRKASSSKLPATSPARTPRKPKKQYLCFDPVTGGEIITMPNGKKVILPPPGAATRMATSPTSALSAEQRAYFDWLAPQLIRRCCDRYAAREQLTVNAAAKWHNAGPQVTTSFVAAGMAELDALTPEVAAAKYGLKLAECETWFRQWTGAAARAP